VNNKTQKTNILGIGVSAINIEMTISQIEKWIDHKQKSYICCTNTHLLSESLKSDPLHRALNNADLVTPDGMPLVWLSKWYGKKHVSRVYGPDLLLEVCRVSSTMKWKHYFYGGAQGVAEKLVANLKTKFPNLDVVGIYSPPFRPIKESEDLDDVTRINACQPDIVWVGLGAPKQELWMASHRLIISAPVMIGIGAAFDFHAGVKKQAPRWMRKNGLEWFYRLATEPRRLGRRYVVNNSRFLFWSLLQILGIRKFEVKGRIPD
jgi:N-acetylglucosaminyldiphosphoundecaprenol N-acetyl-beta-D-mannosaminyltransferase